MSQRASRSRLLALAAWVLGTAAACPAPTSRAPGDLVLGTFDISVSPIEGRNTCSPTHPDLVEIPEGRFSFFATFSRDSVSGQAWVTVDGYPRPATFSRAQQAFASYFRTLAPLRSCGDGCQQAQMEERLEVVILSDSQWRQVGEQCERLKAEGLPEGPGSTPPAPTIYGYDARQLCGELAVDLLPPEQGCDCTEPACTIVYTVEGVRHFE